MNWSRYEYQYKTLIKIEYFLQQKMKQFIILELPTLQNLVSNFIKQLGIIFHFREIIIRLSLYKYISALKLNFW